MIFPHELAATVASQALNSVPAGLAIAAAAWLGLKLFSKQGSGIRFVVWFVALLAITSLPFVSSLRSYDGRALPLQEGLMLPGSWATALVFLWTGILALAMLRFAFGVWNLWKLKRQATPIALSELPLQAQAIVSEAQAQRPVQLRISTRVRVPTAIGFLKPAVLLPAWALQLSEQDLNAVLLHEFAHLRRMDDWTNLAQKFLGALFFFHPAVWFVQRRLELEREMACDELVLAKMADRHAYAECLISLAEKTFARRSLAMAQSLIGHAKSTTMRLARILDINKSSKPAPLAGAIALASAALLLCAGLAASAPKFISFEDHVSRTSENAALLDKAMPQVNAAPAKIDATFHPPRQSAKNAKLPIAPKSLPALAHKKSVPRVEEVLARETVPDNSSLTTQYVLVMQTQLDGDGEMQAKFCVWKLTLRDSDNRTIRAQVVMSSL